MCCGISASLPSRPGWLAQTFTAGLSGTLAGVNISIPTSRDYSLKVAILSTNDGEPTSTILGETTIAGLGGATQIRMAPISELITFPQAIDIVAGVKYAIGVTFVTDKGSGAWWGAQENGYSGGEQYRSSNGTTGTFVPVASGYDLHFQTYVSE